MLGTETQWQSVEAPPGGQWLARNWKLILELAFLSWPYPWLQAFLCSLWICKPWGYHPKNHHVCRFEVSASKNSEFLSKLFSPLSNSRSQAKVITERDGWPQVFEDAIVARWASDKPLSTPYTPSILPTTTPQSTSKRVVGLVAWNLRQLGRTYQSKQYSNIIANIQLAASYLNIMTLVILSFCQYFFCWLFYRESLTSLRRKNFRKGSMNVWRSRHHLCSLCFSSLLFFQFKITTKAIQNPQGPRYLSHGISGTSFLCSFCFTNPFIPNMSPAILTLWEKPLCFSKYHILLCCTAS